MMTKEEVTSIVTYCQMHKVSYSKRLKELGVPTWKFYEYKSRYASEPQVGKAIKYTYGHLPSLSNYVNDGRINIDNNLIENAIRPLALGRKDYLFCGNDASAYRAAIVYSLIGTCKAVGVDPRVWMVDVLRRLPYYQRDGKDVAELLPRTWKALHPDN